MRPSDTPCIPRRTPTLRRERPSAPGRQGAPLSRGSPWHRSGELASSLDARASLCWQAPLLPTADHRVRHGSRDASACGPPLNPLLARCPSRPGCSAAARPRRARLLRCAPPLAQPERQVLTAGRYPGVFAPRASLPCDALARLPRSRQRAIRWHTGRRGLPQRLSPQPIPLEPL